MNSKSTLSNSKVPFSFYITLLSNNSASLESEEFAADDEMVRQHHWLHGLEFEQTLRESGGQRSLACGSSWGHRKSDVTSRLNNNKQLNKELIKNKLRLFIETKFKKIGYTQSKIMQGVLGTKLVQKSVAISCT